MIDRDACSCSASYFLNAQTGGLHGNGKQDSDPQGMLTTGDIIGVLVDLDVGWLRFYRNGARYGLGYTEGVTGPLVCAARLGSNKSNSTSWGWSPGSPSAPFTVTLLSGTVAPSSPVDGGESKVNDGGSS